MLIHKSFVYRVYPSEEQVARLGQWNDALRFLWNLANEQRLMGLARCGKDKRAASTMRLRLKHALGAKPNVLIAHRPCARLWALQ